MDEQAEVHTVYCGESKSVCSPRASTVEQQLSTSIKTALACSVKCLIKEFERQVVNDTVMSKSKFIQDLYTGTGDPGGN